MQAKYLIDTLENKKFLEDARNSLFNFGHQFPSPGGGSYYLGDDGTPWKERNRETWITSRMVHVYSMASFLGHEGSEALIDAGLKGLMGELHDKENGGWYAGVQLTVRLVLITNVMHTHLLFWLLLQQQLLEDQAQKNY